MTEMCSPPFVTFHRYFFLSQAAEATLLKKFTKVLCFWLFEHNTCALENRGLMGFSVLKGSSATRVSRVQGRRVDVIKLRGGM